jgi:hypothetical protein
LKHPITLLLAIHKINLLNRKFPVLYKNMSLRPLAITGSSVPRLSTSQQLATIPPEPIFSDVPAIEPYRSRRASPIASFLPEIPAIEGRSVPRLSTSQELALVPPEPTFSTSPTTRPRPASPIPSLLPEIPAITGTVGIGPHLQQALDELRQFVQQLQVGFSNNSIVFPSSLQTNQPQEVYMIIEDIQDIENEIRRLRNHVFEVQRRIPFGGIPLEYVDEYNDLMSRARFVNAQLLHQIYDLRLAESNIFYQ